MLYPSQQWSSVYTRLTASRVWKTSAEMQAKFLFYPFLIFNPFLRHVNRYYSIRLNNEANGLWKQISLQKNSIMVYTYHTILFDFSLMIVLLIYMVRWTFDDSMIWYKKRCQIYVTTICWLYYIYSETLRIEMRSMIF
jgi:hypothetical protein